MKELQEALKNANVGQKLYKHVIDLLHSSGRVYIEYLNSKSYRKQECCDLDGAVSKALIVADRTGLKLLDGIEIADPKRDDNIEILDRYKIDKAQENFDITNEGGYHE